ncbi:DnaB-like helicase C-terminal domain-containing protein [Streptomyces guryensis]|uniref:SF4 helicase domain-containing protein n=1 Tax=Streptomyces guryensis TaxID=2886947 RepID=A0A9Q3VUP5_9ACTN|nr:DnaB-like helicase C-terminal domain-containing protein [Streptomyces guryensis]MCD9878497.1 hypothetical protein [Streptomyces guryensis]
MTWATDLWSSGKISKLFEREWVTLSNAELFSQILVYEYRRPPALKPSAIRREPDRVCGELAGRPASRPARSGLHPGQLIVLAACPARGRPIPALDFVCSAGIQHTLPSPACILEADRQEFGMSILSAECRVILRHILSGMMAEADWTRPARRIPDVSCTYSNLHDRRR